MQLRTTGSRNIRSRIGGGPDVWWPVVAVVGFLCTTAVVIALARSSTARWEREKRAARAARREAVAPPTPAGVAARLRGTLVRGTAAARHGAASVGRPLKAVPGVLESTRQQVLSQRRPFRHPAAALRSVVGGARGRHAKPTEIEEPELPVDDGGAGGTDLPVPEPQPRGSRRHARRRALPFVHRHDRRQDPRPLHSDVDEGPSPRS